MQDTHEFFGLLRKFGVERQQSFRVAEGRFTRRAPAAVARHLLQEAAFDGAPIMVFVGSPGCIQIHSGPVVRVELNSLSGQVIDVALNRDDYRALGLMLGDQVFVRPKKVAVFVDEGANI